MFEAYSESEPDNAWGHYMLGLSAWKTGDHTRALEAFDAALRLDPTHRKSLLNSARVLLETSRPKDALNRVEQALAIEPLSGEGLRLLGRAHYELGEVDEAIDAYQRALALDDKDVWAMNNLGYLYIQQGRSDAALPPLARAVEIRGNVPVFQNNFAHRARAVGALRRGEGGVREGARGRQHLRQGGGRTGAGDDARRGLGHVDGGRAGAGPGVRGRDRAVADAPGDRRLRREARGFDGRGLDADGAGFGGGVTQLTHGARASHPERSEGGMPLGMPPSLRSG